MFKKLLFVLFTTTAVSLSALAAEITVPLFTATEQGAGDKIGDVVITESDFGLIFAPSLKGITPGIHGFHVHANGDCSPATKDGITTPAGAAGGHFDPDNADAHKGPYDKTGRLGDLPALYADENGDVTNPVLAPRITKLSQIKAKSLVLHVGGDNYSDNPAALGGGGARLACGVIK